MTTAYLAHHGILGQKWGTRRYQNPDGSLTEAGKAREKRWKGPDTARYRRLNRKADKGDALRAQGRTITGNNEATRATNSAMLLGAAALGIGLGGTSINMRYGNTKLGSINSKTLRTGSLIAASLLATKTMVDNSRIRASYRRDQARGDYWAG